MIETNTVTFYRVLKSKVAGYFIIIMKKKSEKSKIDERWKVALGPVTKVSPYLCLIAYNSYLFSCKPIKY
jgi:hypothetical protein